MNKEIFNKLCRYSMVMQQAEKMLRQGIITKEEYLEIDTKTAKQIGINSGSIFLENHLLYSGFRGNM